MAEIWCVGCGTDLPNSRERVSFSNDSGDRQKVLSALKELILAEREKRNLAGVCSVPSSVKMCRSCFSAYKTYSDKKAAITERLQLAFIKTSFMTINESSTVAATSESATSEPIRDEDAG